MTLQITMMGWQIQPDLLVVEHSGDVRCVRWNVRLRQQFSAIRHRGTKLPPGRVVVQHRWHFRQLQAAAWLCGKVLLLEARWPQTLCQIQHTCWPEADLLTLTGAWEGKNCMSAVSLCS